MSLFIQQLVNGLGIGAQYALWAVGYGLVYQVLGLLHFAHGDTVLLAVFLAFTLLAVGVPFWLVVLVAVLVGAVAAVAMERVVYRPLFKRDQMFLAFVAALAAAFVLRNIVTLIWGVNTRVFPAGLIPSQTFVIGGIRVGSLAVLNLVVALVVVGLFQLYLARGRSGQAILAVAQDRETAMLMGIPLSRIIATVYGLSGAIGVVGALLFVINFQSVTVGLGFVITLKAFVAAIIGGIGSVRGAVVGGLFLGVMEALIAGFVTTLLLDAAVVGVVVVLLVFRPTGIMGRRDAVKL